MFRALVRVVAVVAALAGAGYAAFQLSPWPGALVIRVLMDRGGVAAAQALEKHVPAGVTGRIGEAYQSDDESARFDVFYPLVDEGKAIPLPTVVWVHGGAWLSGDKEHVANYLKIITAKGYVTIGVNYGLAPSRGYPEPVRQVNSALAYLIKNAARLNIDPDRLFLAGDSAGAQIAAQTAAIVTSPAYAASIGIEPGLKPSQLRGVLLLCGAYDASLLNLEGVFGWFLRTVLWSYFGTKDFLADPRLAQFSVARHITPQYPPLFIAVGNADPLAPQSVAFAEAAAGLGVPVDKLFFPKDYIPPLRHEFQFNLDVKAGRLALERTLAFLAARSK